LAYYSCYSLFTYFSSSQLHHFPYNILWAIQYIFLPCITFNISESRLRQRLHRYYFIPLRHVYPFNYLSSIQKANKVQLKNKRQHIILFFPIIYPLIYSFGFDYCLALLLPRIIHYLLWAFNRINKKAYKSLTHNILWHLHLFIKTTMAKNTTTNI